MKFESKVISFASYIWNRRITKPGKHMILSAVVAGLVGIPSFYVPIYQLSISLFCFLGFTFLVGLFFRPRVKIKGNFPEQIGAGHTVSAQFSLTNISRMPAFDVGLSFFELGREIEIHEKDRTVSCILPKETVKYTIRLTAHKRGLYVLPRLRTYSTFPFMLFRNGTTRTAQPRKSIVVTPEFTPLQHFQIPTGRRYQTRGVRQVSSVGESMEYIGNRDYHSGDPLKKIDFRSWARTARPVVREYQEEYFSRIALILDTKVTNKKRPRRGGFDQLEAGIQLTAGIADAISQRDSVIDFFSVGPDLHIFRAGRRMAPMERVLEILASVEPVDQDPMREILPLIDKQLNEISVLIAVLYRWDRITERLVDSALSEGVSLKLIFIDCSQTPPLNENRNIELRFLKSSEILENGAESI